MTEIRLTYLHLTPAVTLTCYTRMCNSISLVAEQQLSEHMLTLWLAYSRYIVDTRIRPFGITQQSSQDQWLQGVMENHERMQTPWRLHVMLNSGIHTGKRLYSGV